MLVAPYPKSFADFLGSIRIKYGTDPYPESYIPLIARKATSYYTCQRFLPDRIDQFIELGGAVAFAISEPEWKNSPANLKSELIHLGDGNYTARIVKGFVLQGEAAIFVLKCGREFAFLWLDRAEYQAHQMMLDRADSVFQMSETEKCVHYKLDFTAKLVKPDFRPIRKREMLLHARDILYREQVAYAVLAACEAKKHGAMSSIESKLDHLVSIVDEAPSADALTIAKEILAQSMPHILSGETAHPFWKWLSRFAG